MDKMIFTALTTLKYVREENAIHANNLSNAMVPGFRRDIEPMFIEAGFLDHNGRHQARAFGLREGLNRFSNTPGQLDYTGLETDVAIRGDGFFFIKPENGAIGLSRRGDMHVSPEGVLLNGAGDRMMDFSMAEIIIPPHRNLIISQGGEVSVERLDAEPGVREVVGILATVNGEFDLRKFDDGIIRQRDGNIPEANQEATLVQGYIEKSNVDAVEELIGVLNRQRHFEINTKLISIVKELDEEGANILRMPQ